MNKKKYIISSIAVLLVVLVVTLVAVLSSNSGNSKKYSVDKIETTKELEITNKGIIFLGSSFTNGYKTNGSSFVDYLDKAYDVKTLKLADNKAKITGNKKNDYISRLKAVPTDITPHIFMCELSPYDLEDNVKTGELEEEYMVLDSFDTTTLIGSLEYIVCYAQSTWHCPIIFYTCPYVENDDYNKMIDALNQVCDKWNVKVIDLYNEYDINELSKDDKKLYVIDNIYPTRAGYKNVWTPKFEEYLVQFVK